MGLFRRLDDIAADPAAYAQRWKAATGSKVVGHMCTYTPEELIVAAGALPFRIYGSGSTIIAAEAHLQGYSCDMVRSTLEDALTGKLAFLDGTVFPQTCDSFQCLSDIWRRNAGCGFHLDVVLPVKLNTDSARRYSVAVLAKFKRDLEAALQTRISDRALREAIRRCNQVRQLLKRLYDVKSSRPGAVSIREVQTAFKAATVMEKSEFIGEMAGILAALETADPEKPIEAKRVVVTGGACLVPDVLDIIEESGGTLVGDDLCTGSRLCEGIIGDQDDGLAALADRFFTLSVCPAKHDGLNRRVDDLMGLVRRTQARGVLILVTKCCDPHGFDLPHLTSAFDAAGIPNHVLEIEAQLPPGGQWRTRIEAFLETL